MNFYKHIKKARGRGSLAPLLDRDNETQKNPYRRELITTPGSLDGMSGLGADFADKKDSPYREPLSQLGLDDRSFKHIPGNDYLFLDSTNEDGKEKQENHVGFGDGAGDTRAFYNQSNPLHPINSNPRDHDPNAVMGNLNEKTDFSRVVKKKSDLSKQKIERLRNGKYYKDSSSIIKNKGRVNSKST
jgi:hypothetical protein